MITEVTTYPLWRSVNGLEPSLPFTAFTGFKPANRAYGTLRVPKFLPWCQGSTVAQRTGIEPAFIHRDRVVISSRYLTLLGPAPEIRTQTGRALDPLSLPIGVEQDCSSLNAGIATPHLQGLRCRAIQRLLTFGTRQEIRTPTVQGLSLLRLPVAPDEFGESLEIRTLT